MPDKKKKQTAMQELIKNFSTMKHVEFIVWLHWAKDELLQKERDQMKCIALDFDRWKEENQYRIDNTDQRTHTNSELFDIYFTQTYNQ